MCETKPAGLNSATSLLDFITPHADASVVKKPAKDSRSIVRRVLLWECPDNIHCSVVGTCASMKDIRSLAAKLNIGIDLTRPDYDVHGWLVRQTAENTPFARAFQKLMGQRFSGAIRRLGRVKEREDQCALWEEMRDRGLIAAAYWAFMTAGHVPGDIRSSIFGEVHMLSHLAGSSYRRRTEQAVALQDQLQQAEERAHRIESGLYAALNERDQQIATLQQQILRERSRPSVEPARRDPSIKKLQQRIKRMERALQVTRVRARQVEDAFASAKHTAQSRKRTVHRLENDAVLDAGDKMDLSTWPVSVSGKTILYIGGRSGHVDRLKAVAAEFKAELVHHDGGKEDAVRRIDHLLPSVECVLCPIDCISHDACLRAKRSCQRLGKPFLPLRTSSQSALRSALHDMSTLRRSHHREQRV